MSHIPRTRMGVPPWLELAAPPSAPILPEPSRGQPSDDEIIDWYTSVLRWYIRQMALGNRDAQQWADAIDVTDPLSFVNVCRFFHVDPYRMRDRIEEWVAVRRRRRLDPEDLDDE